MAKAKIQNAVIFNMFVVVLPPIFSSNEENFFIVSRLMQKRNKK